MVLVSCFNTSAELSALRSLHAVRLDRHTNTDEHTSRQKWRRAASFWLSAAVSSWQLANASTFASDNPGPEPACLCLSVCLSLSLCLSLCSPLSPSLISSLPLFCFSLLTCDSGPCRAPLLPPSLFSSATSCRLPLAYTQLNSLPSRFQVPSLSSRGEGKCGGLC